MRRRSRDIQADLFGDLNTLAPPLIRERPALYCAVLYTRIFRNKTCWRAGIGKHVVAGKQLTSAQLVATVPAISAEVRARLGFYQIPTQ